MEWGDFRVVTRGSKRARKLSGRTHGGKQGHFREGSGNIREGTGDFPQGNSQTGVFQGGNGIVQVGHCRGFHRAKRVNTKRGISEGTHGYFRVKKGGL